MNLRRRLLGRGQLLTVHRTQPRLEFNRPIGVEFSDSLGLFNYRSAVGLAIPWGKLGFSASFFVVVRVGASASSGCFAPSP